MNKQYSQTLAALLKRGRFDEARDFLAEGSNSTQETFFSYMEEKIAQSGMSRAKIVEQVGLSRDYMYKVLRGDKVTTERDYIIALCVSMGLGLMETQHALELYPFPILDEADKRSAIIMCAIMEGADIYTLDEWLEKARLLPIKVSPDMESAKVGPVRSTLFAVDVLKSESVEGQKPSPRRVEMQITNTKVIAQQCGNAPFDYFYLGEFELTDGQKKVYASAFYYPDGQSFFGVYNFSCDDEVSEEEGKAGTIEQFETLEEASQSPYFSYYLELNRLTDQKAAETMDKVLDTKYYGFRMGAHWEDGGMLMYAECFNDTQPEYKEYLQVRETKDGYIFSASHESYYMQYELSGIEGFYEAYFGPMEKPLYLFEIDSLDKLGKYNYFEDGFKQMLTIMKDFKEGK